MLLSPCSNDCGDTHFHVERGGSKTYPVGPPAASYQHAVLKHTEMQIKVTRVKVIIQSPVTSNQFVFVNIGVKGYIIYSAIFMSSIVYLLSVPELEPKPLLSTQH